MLKMITLKEAFKIAQEYANFGFPLSRIADEIDDLWIFLLDTDEVLIGPADVAVDKKTGRAFRAVPGFMTDKQYEAWENAKKVEVPQE